MDHETTITVGKVPAEALPTLVAAKPANAPLCGSVLVLIQFDVCEEIRLDQLREILGARTVDASAVVVDAVRRAEMDSEHAALDDLLK